MSFETYTLMTVGIFRAWHGPPMQSIGMAIRKKVGRVVLKRGLDRIGRIMATSQKVATRYYVVCCNADQRRREDHPTLLTQPEDCGTKQKKGKNSLVAQSEQRTSGSCVVSPNRNNGLLAPADGYFVLT